MPPAATGALAGGALQIMEVSQGLFVPVSVPSNTLSKNEPLIGSSTDSSDAISLLELSIDDLLRLGVGEFGKAQRKHYFLVSLAWLAEACQTMVMLFTDKEPEWRCVADANERLIACTASADLCQLESFQWEWVDRTSSTVAEFSLICRDGWKAGLVGSGFFLGVLLGAGIFGMLSDGLLGWKRTLFLCCTFAAVLGPLTALAPTFYSYLLLRMLTGFGVGGLGLVSFVLATEPVGLTYRGKAGLGVQYFYTAGLLLLPLLAYLIHSWRVLMMVTSLPTAAFLLCWWVVEESPRWLLAHDRPSEALAVLSRFALGNSGAPLPKHFALRRPPSTPAAAANTPHFPSRRNSERAAILAKSLGYHPSLALPRTSSGGAVGRGGG